MTGLKFVVVSAVGPGIEEQEALKKKLRKVNPKATKQKPKSESKTKVDCVIS
jgi:hypothetical protein